MRKSSLILFVLFMTGCATTQPIENYISTNPSEARVYLNEPATSKNTFVGVTPCKVTFKKRFWDLYLVIEKNGYETERYPLPITNPSISINLQETYGRKIEREKTQYSKEFINTAIDVLGLCKRAAHSPRFLAASVASEASTSLDKLKVNYPTQREAALTIALGKAVVMLEQVTSLDSSQYNTTQEEMLASQASYYIGEIDKGLGI